ncbi:MAG: hypothetical protein H7246_13185 [Phycisphaerae bacterium]|nr:hypothetical protein [Saprospiraceae bacterium]
MKKIFFAIPALTMAVFFAFCSKPESTSDLNTVHSTTKNTDRGACTVYIYPLTYAALTYCGTETNATACSTCVGDSKGVEVITGDASFVLSNPTSFSISSAFATSVILATDNNQIGPIAIGANGCEVFTVDDNCEVHH